MLNSNLGLDKKDSTHVRIAVVEDEKIIAMEISKTLERMGYRVPWHVGSGEEALELLDQEPADLVLMDIHLRGLLDGIETAEILTKRFGIPLIYLTANADDETIQRAKLSSPYSYLLKPINFRDLHTAIQIALHKYESELRVKQNEAKYRRVFEQSNDGMIIFNTDGGILDCNTKAHQMLGYAREPFFELNLPGLHTAATQNAYKGAMHQLTTSGNMRYEASMVKADGHEVDVEINGSWFEASGQQGLVVIRDMSQQRLAERSSRIVSEEVAGYTGEAFFQHLVKQLAEILSMDIAFIHEIEPATGDSVKAIAFYDKGLIVPNIQYHLSGMPCEDVIKRRMLIVDRDIIKKYPKASLLQEMHIESFAGVPLFSPSGVSLGHLTVMHRKPLENETLVRSILQLFALRAASELTRMNHERTLQAREKQYRMLFNSGNDAVFVYHIDENGIPSNLLKVNDVACDLLGFDRKSLLSCFPNDILETDTEKLISVSTPDNVLFEAELRTKAGYKIPVEVNTNRFQLGNQTTVLAVARDIRARKAVESALLKERQLSEKLLEHSPALIFIKDVNGCYVLANPLFLDFVGQPREAVLGRKASDFFSHPHSDIGEKSEQFVRETRQPVLNQEELVYDAQGEAHWLLTSKMPYFDETGALLGIIGIAQDITSRVASEKEMKQAMLASESANRAKSEFLANISHELRTPMNGIIGLTELARDSVEDPEVARYLEMVSQSADSLLIILNDLLDFAKIEAGKVELEESDFNLQHFANELMHLYCFSSEQKGLTLDCSLAPELKLDLKGDVGRLKQILNNLLSNALKFTDEGGIQLEIVRFDMACTDDSLHCLPHYQYVLFRIRDTGIGIPAEDLETIFASFSQVDGSLTRKYGGTGLGLAISRQLVEMMGGEIWAESDPGTGSLFQFYIPFKMTDKPTTPRLSEPVSYMTDLGDPRECFNGHRLLVVEDEPVNREVVVRFLNKWGADVVTANHGKEALVLLAEQPFDLVIMDVQMPVLDGLEATKLIRSGHIHNVDPEIPIIALTAHARDRDRRHCLEMGMDDYISKPIDSAVFYQVLKRHLTEVGERHAVNDVVAAETVRRQVINSKQVLLRLAGDTELLIKTMAVFETHVPARMASLSRAVKDKDREEVEHLAHSLKSAAANIGAEEMGEWVISLEEQSAEAAWSRVLETYHEVERAYQHVMAILPQMITTGQKQTEEWACRN